MLAPYFLNRIELAPGEALYLPPGELHCYLAGTAIELMASSDNVIRGGLTTKQVAIDELLRVARFASRRPPILRAEQRGSGESVWRTPAVEFELSSLQPDTGRPCLVAARTGGEILWCSEGRMRVTSTEGGELVLISGESCIVPAAAGPYRITGAGRAFRAALPDC